MTYMLPMPTATIAKKKTLLMALNETAGQVNMKTTEKYFIQCFAKKGQREWKEVLEQKKHYGLKKIRAMTQLNEELWIFFGVHTANAIRITQKMVLEKQITI